MGIFEVMPVTPDLQQMMLAGGSSSTLTRQCRLSGVPSLRRAGLEKVLQGLTSLTEILSETESDDSLRDHG